MAKKKEAPRLELTINPTVLVKFLRGEPLTGIERIILGQMQMALEQYIAQGKSGGNRV